MVWGKASSTTLSSAGDSVSSGTFTASKCNQLMTHISDVGGQLAVDMRFNSDTGNNYAFRRNNDGGTDATTASTSNITLHSSEVTEDLFSNVFIINNSSNEKLVIGHTIQNHTLGAGNIPKRKEFVGKWANTSSQITQVDFSTYSGSGDYDTGSNLSVLGSEITPAAAITFPTNVQLGSRAEITDSRKMYDYVVPSLTFEDDFSSDNWTDSDSSRIGVSGGALNWSMFRDMSNDASSRDLTSTSTNWVLRFKVTQGSSIGSTQAGNGFHFGISDSDNSVAQNASQDFVGMSYYYDNQSSYKAQDSDGAAVPEISQGDSSQNFTITANDVFYFEIIKNGSSYTVEGFTNSDYSTGSLGKITGTTTATGLQYLKIMNTLPAQGAIPTSTNPFSGMIDDVKFYDGVTQTTNYWQEIGA